MPDGSVGEVRESEINAATRREQEAVQAEERRRADLDTQMDAIQRVEREDAQQRERERGVDLPESEVRAAEEQRARARVRDEQIDAFTLERELEQAKVDSKERQDRRAARRLGLRDDQIEDQPVLPGFEQDTEVQREMFGTRRVAGKDVPTIKRQKVTPESERLMTKPTPAPEQQEMRLEEPRAERKQIEQPLIGPRGGIPRRTREPFRQPAPKAQEPTPAPDILTAKRLDDLGIAPKSPVRRLIVGKDINQPAIQQRLQNFVESPRLGSQQARANVARLLEGVSEKQGDLFTPTTQRRGPAPETGVRDARVAEPQQVPSGVSVPTAVPNVGAERAVPPTQPDTAVAVAPEGTGVADTGRGVREPVRGAVAEQLALETTRGTKPGEKTTTPKQVTQKDKKAKAPAEQKKKVKAKSTPKKEAPKRAKLGDDPEVRARLESLKERP